MKRDTVAALGDLFTSGNAFDEVVATLSRNRDESIPALVGLLQHRDPGWRQKAAVALGRMRDVPERCLADLLRLLRSEDATARVAAISAIEWLPAHARNRAVPAVIRLLRKRPDGPRFTLGMANVPRAVAAHFLGIHGGVRGVSALKEASEWRNDPVGHHIRSALKDALKRKQFRDGRKARVSGHPERERP